MLTNILEFLVNCVILAVMCWVGGYIISIFSLIFFGICSAIGAGICWIVKLIKGEA